MTCPSHPERFHALDATRAFALLLGVVFHTAWSFVPRPMGAPIVDVSGNELFDWFFFTSHMFRMQLFFLIAGFFAHMVCHRRGFREFVRNRLQRIGVPLVVGWIVLYPLIMAVFITGANVSGRNLEPLPLPTLFYLMYGWGLFLVPRSLGGLFSLTHLWFLYYLLLLYALVLGSRHLLSRSATLAAWSRKMGDAGVERAIRSPWSLVGLSLVTGLFLWTMQGWFGVDTPVGTPAPSVSVLVFYGTFFLFGWLLHRHAGLLRSLARHWRWQLGFGLALSVLIFASYRSVCKLGLSSTSLSAYPLTDASQITEWPAFIERLQSAADSSTSPPELRHLWAHLPEGTRRRILTLNNQATPDERQGVAQALVKLQPQPGMFEPDPIPPGFVPTLTEARRAVAVNRAELDRLFVGSLVGDPKEINWYRPAKLAYSVGYGLVMWMLVFGTLGFFQERCPGHSRAWRYVADSSYWIYLVHLPLVAGLQIWMAPWNWPGVAKFLLLNLVAFVVLFASYHFLVRSTFIGKILNGRAYPFVLLPWPTSAAEDRPPTPARAIPVETGESSPGQA